MVPHVMDVKRSVTRVEDEESEKYGHSKSTNYQEGKGSNVSNGIRGTNTKSPGNL